MNINQHEKLINEFINRGGNKRIVDGLRAFSLQNYARLKYELSKLGSPEPTAEPIVSVKVVEKKKHIRKGFNDLISEYPPELHPVYSKRLELWLSICSLKLQLNEESNESKAFDIQLDIYGKFKELDHYQRMLSHYKDTKRIMIPETEKKFSNLSNLQLLKMQNNLRASITRRQQTIDRKEKALGDNPTHKELNSINLKKERLQEKINELFECEKFLKNE